MGRPVGVAIDSQGGLLVADDVGNTIWRVRAGAYDGWDEGWLCAAAVTTATS